MLPMSRILLLVAGWVGRGVAFRLSTLRRPKVAEILALRERIDRLRAENEILRSRLLKIESYRRPHFQPWQRLAILWHRARYGMSLDATAQSAPSSTSSRVRCWRSAFGRRSQARRAP